ncbi:MAG: hypothetical protein KA004_10500 [Verrucomicrobiales bacterium]|nr:hypothetical protein [Verrucomicrobiales bacterium]
MRLHPIPQEEAAWRCFRTKPKSEHLAAQHLRIAGFDAYSPRLRHMKKTARGKVWFVEALFPGYAFARFPLTSNRQVQATAYVAGLLHFTPEFGRLADDTVADLRAQFPGESPQTVEEGFQVGETVSVADGPLQGAEAVITSLLPGRDRVRILLDFLGSPREMEVSLTRLLGFKNPRQIIAGRED